MLNERDVSGLDENELADIRNQEIGFIFQSFNLLPRASALKNVMQPLIYRGMSFAERKAEAERVLERVGLARSQRSPAEPAVGRTAAARGDRARARHEPVDPARPTSRPAISIRRRASRSWRLFDELHNDGQTIIVVTHEPDVAAHGERVVRLKDGKVVEDRRNERDPSQH